MSPSLKREILVLLLLLLVVDAAFIAAYFLIHLRHASDGGKLVFTTAWTLVILAVVLSGLARVRRARLPRGLSKSS